MSEESKSVRQDEVEKLLNEARQSGGEAPEQAASPPAAATAPPPTEDGSGGPLDQNAIEALLQQAGAGEALPAKPKPVSSEAKMEGLLDQAAEALATVDGPSAELPPGMQPFEFRSLTGKSLSADAATLDLLRDVQLDLKIELGRTHMQLDEVLQLKKGAVVTLDKLAGDPVDIFVNGRLIARGEVLVLNDNFCVRVAELVAGESTLA